LSGLAQSLKIVCRALLQLRLREVTSVHVERAARSPHPQDLTPKYACLAARSGGCGAL